MLRKNYFLLFFAVVIECVSCSSVEPGKVSFHGSWNDCTKTLMGEEKTRKIVDTDGTRFRIETDFMIQVFDGIKMYTKSKPYASASSADGQIDLYEENTTKEKAKQYIFWTRHLGNKTGPGGMVAGRETVLYAGAENRPDGKLSVQWWVDGKTGIVLKSMTSIYSKQVNETIHEESMECESISYGPIDSNLLTKPE